MKTLSLTVNGLDSTQTLDFQIKELVIGGWAGRDKASMEHHIAELEALGVKRPVRTPLYYPVAASRLNTHTKIQDLGATSSGEVETVLLSQGGKLYVGLGSDHTDRQLETHGVNISKQVSDKPIAKEVWLFDDVQAHWDSLILRSYAVIDGKRKLYQEGGVDGLLAPLDLIKGFNNQTTLPEGTALFGGTMPAIGGIQMASRFEGELEDPVLKRKIQFAYDIEVLETQD